MTNSIKSDAECNPIAMIIKLNKGEYISQVEPFKSIGLYPNAIYHKTEAGCGFTRFAIEFFKRHLILIEPNVPVIIDKVANHNKRFPKDKILGVYKGIDVDDIKEYLMTDIKFKKIITTPEGFMKKVVNAFENVETMRKDYFLLYDECERIISDVDYRGEIAAPLEEFFLFDNKAMVSATTLPYSDERLNNFKHYIIEPEYDYSKPITVIKTNNVIAALKTHLDKLNSDHNCIFMNSTKAIGVTAKHLNLKDSRAFCSQESVVKLMSDDYKRGTSSFSVELMAKYNFFTSRYYSAFDIELDYKPDLMIVTDIFFAEQSIADPQTEVIQIAGRFRNGVNSITHITNLNPDLDAKTEEEAKFFLKGSLKTYDTFVNDYRKATNAGSKKTLLKAIRGADEHRYYVDGKLNLFMVDNFIQGERVKGYYQHIDKLKAAYLREHKHFKPTFVDDVYTVGDADFLSLIKERTKRETNRAVAKIFDEWTPKEGGFAFPPMELFNRLIRKHTALYSAFISIGLRGLEESGYVWSRIKQLVKKAKENEQLKRLAPYVYGVFNPHRTYKEAEIITDFEQIYRECGITKRVTAAEIGKYFDALRITKEGRKAYTLGSRKIDCEANPQNTENILL